LNRMHQKRQTGRWQYGLQAPSEWCQESCRYSVTRYSAPMRALSTTTVQACVFHTMCDEKGKKYKP
jgi:hypothetical protein